MPDKCKSVCQCHYKQIQALAFRVFYFLMTILGFSFYCSYYDCHYHYDFCVKPGIATCQSVLRTWADDDATTAVMIMMMAVDSWLDLQVEMKMMPGQLTICRTIEHTKQRQSKRCSWPLTKTTFSKLRMPQHWHLSVLAVVAKIAFYRKRNAKWGLPDLSQIEQKPKPKTTSFPEKINQVAT